MQVWFSPHRKHMHILVSFMLMFQRVVIYIEKQLKLGRVFSVLLLQQMYIEHYCHCWVCWCYNSWHVSLPLQLVIGCGPGSSVGIVTGYGLDSPGIKSRWGQDFLHCPDRPWGPPSLLYIGYRIFPGVESSWDVTLTPHPLLVPRSKKSRAIPLLSLKAFLACKKGETYF
jgi:hypothetical protein